MKFSKDHSFNLLISIFFLVLAIHVPMMMLKFDLPLALLYGPILWVSIQQLLGKKLSRIVLLLHFLPFVVFSVYYLLVRNNIHGRDVILFLSVDLISLLLYTSYILLEGLEKRSEVPKYRILLLEVLSLFGLAVSFFLALELASRFLVFNMDVAPNTVIIAISLITLAVLIGYFFSKYVKGNPEEGLTYVDPEGLWKEDICASEMKSSLFRIDQAMEKDKLFLDANLTPEKILIQTRVTRQIFQLHLNQVANSNFDDWVARYRIGYALHILKTKSGDVKMDVLANLCGFHSKNRFKEYFKRFVGISLTDYKIKYNV